MICSHSPSKGSFWVRRQPSTRFLRSCTRYRVRFLLPDRGCSSHQERFPHSCNHRTFAALYILGEQTLSRRSSLIVLSSSSSIRVLQSGDHRPPPGAQSRHFSAPQRMIPFLVGASSRKGNLLSHTIGSDFLVDKFPTVIGIQSQDWKREKRSSTLESYQQRLSPTVEQGKTFGPADSDIGQRDRVHATTLYSHSTVGTRVPPEDKPGLALSHRARVRIGDLLFEQRTWFGGRKAMG